MDNPAKYSNPVLYRPMTEADGEVGRFVVKLRNRLALYEGEGVGSPSVEPQNLDIERRVTTPLRKERPATKIERMVSDGLDYDGDHHARWYLERVADLLGVPVNERRGIVP